MGLAQPQMGRRYQGRRQRAVLEAVLSFLQSPLLAAVVAEETALLVLMVGLAEVDHTQVMPVALETLLQ